MNTATRITSALVLFGSAGLIIAQPAFDGTERSRDRAVGESQTDRADRARGERGPRQRGPAHHQQMLERFDADGDGELSETERQTARAEFESLKAGKKAQMKARLLERFDDNNDGELDDAERAIVRETLGPMLRQQRERGAREGGRDANRRNHMKREAMKRFDTNEDGQLDDAEKAQAKAFFEARKAEIIARFDADGDGELNDAERQAAKAHHREQRRLDIDRNGVVDANDVQAATDQLATGERFRDLNGDGIGDAGDLVELTERIKAFNAD